MIGRPVLPILLAAATAGGAILAQQGGPHPGDVIRQATAAVERDSVNALRARWGSAPGARSLDGERESRLGLATLDWLTYRYDDAERTLAALASGGLRDPVAVFAQLGRAEAADKRGELQRADSLAQLAYDAARALGDDEAEGRALVLLARTRGPVQGIDSAATLLDRAERVLPARATDVRAELLRFRAVLLAVRADFDSTKAVVGQCLAAAREARLLRATAQCHRSQALAYRLGAVDDSAVALLDEVERLQRAARDNSALAETIMRRADALRARGLFGAAVRAMHESRDLGRETGNDFALGSTHMGLASIALRLRDYGTAARELDAAARLFEATDDIGSYMGVVGFRSILDAAIGDLSTAREGARRAVEHYRQVGDVNEEIAMLRHLASIEMRAGDWDAAHAALAETDDLARRSGRTEMLDMLDFDRGRLALGQGRLDEAEHRFARYRTLLDSSAHVLHYVTRAYLADIHARRGDLARAEHEIAAAGDALDAWRAALPDDRLRLHAFQAVGNDTDSHDPSTERVLAALAAGGRAEAALALAERRRARTLADRMVQGEALRLGDAARRDSVRVRPTLSHAATSAGPAPDAAAAGRAIAATLPDDRTALLEYVSGKAGAPTTLLVATRAGVRAHLLPPADSLSRAIERFVTMIEGGDAPDALARTLGATLLAPALEGLDARVDRLVVVPDGPLHRVPFDALALADGRWAVERYTVSLAPSATVAATLWSRPRRADGAPTRILALGDPVFAGGGSAGRGGTVYRDAADGDGLDGDGLDGDGIDGDGGDRDVFGGDSALARLPASGREARLVAGYASDAEVRLRDEASVAWLREADLASFGVIHLATHALVDDRAIGRSALALSASEGESGFLGAGDLASLRLTADLVVLSACRTAGGVVLDGEGVQGLTAPLLQAGARSVVATSWRIGDASTVRLVRDFYDALAEGQPVGDALRAAKLAAIARGAPPAEWAAFTVIGDPTVTIPLRAPGSRVPMLLLAAGALATVGGLGAVAWHVGRNRV